MFIANNMFITNEIGSIKDGDKYIKKFEKILKTRKLSKSLKLSKLRKSKSEKLFKKPSKNKNLLKFTIKETKLNFLTLNTRTIFNHLWLTFIKASIL